MGGHQIKVQGHLDLSEAKFKKTTEVIGLGVVLHTFNSLHLGSRGRQISEFRASLVHGECQASQDYTVRLCLSKAKESEMVNRLTYPLLDS